MEYGLDYYIGVDCYRDCLSFSGLGSTDSDSSETDVEMMLKEVRAKRRKKALHHARKSRSFSANGVDDVSLKRPLNFTVVPLSSSRHSTLGNNGTVLTHSVNGGGDVNASEAAEPSPSPSPGHTTGDDVTEPSQSVSGGDEVSLARCLNFSVAAAAAAGPSTRDSTEMQHSETLNLSQELVDVENLDDAEVLQSPKKSTSRIVPNTSVSTLSVATSVAKRTRSSMSTPSVATSIATRTHRSITTPSVATSIATRTHRSTTTPSVATSVAKRTRKTKTSVSTPSVVTRRSTTSVAATRSSRGKESSSTSSSRWFVPPDVCEYKKRSRRNVCNVTDNTTSEREVRQHSNAGEQSDQEMEAEGEDGEGEEEEEELKDDEEMEREAEEDRDGVEEEGEEEEEGEQEEEEEEGDETLKAEEEESDKPEGELDITMSPGGRKYRRVLPMYPTNSTPGVRRTKRARIPRCRPDREFADYDYRRRSGVKLRGMLVRVDEKVERKKTKRRKVEDEDFPVLKLYDKKGELLYMHKVVYSIAEAEKVDGAGNPVQDGDNSTVAISRVYSTKTTSVGVINLSQGGIKANSRAEYYDIHFCVIKGKVRFIISGKEYDVPQNFLVIVPAGAQYRIINQTKNTSSLYYQIVKAT